MALSRKASASRRPVARQAMLASPRGGLISFDRNRYSVPCCGLTPRHWRDGPFAPFANRPVSLRIYPERLVVAAEGQILCEHARLIQRSHDLPSRTIYDWRHYLAVVQRKPGALRNGAPFAELPKAFRQLQDQMLRRPPRTVCKQTVAGQRAATARWSTSWHWSCITMNRQF